MNVLLFGATGMVGAGVLLECLEDPRVASVLAVSRASAGISHPKLRETVLADLSDLAAVRSWLASCDACFFCLGVSSAGMREDAYRRITFDLTLGTARAIAEVNTNLTFCYVSGAGTDSTEQGRVMWARVKGATENALLAMPFRRAYMFRPAYIQPKKGVRSKTRLYRAVYGALGSFEGLLRRLIPRYFTTTADLGRAMIQVAESGYHRQILDSPDINRLAIAAAPRLGGVHPAKPGG